MKKKLIVHQFDPEIYPFYLWITVDKDTNKLSEFYTEDDTPVFFPLDPGIDAFVPQEILKYKGHKGFLIHFNEKKLMTVSNICHEVSHALRLIWNYLGEEYVGDEANAYLAGWISKCIEEVKLNK